VQSWTGELLVFAYLSSDTVSLVKPSDMTFRYGNDADFNIMRAVGENLPAAIRGETTILEHMMRDGILDRYYRESLGFSIGVDLLARMVVQISRRYPHMNILEIGAGTGGATGDILEELRTAFTSYTYTDVSSGFFEKAQETFRAHASRMVFKPLNIEKDPTTQGFIEHTYDLVLAAYVLHATRPLEQTLWNARRLLKPGGYLVLLESIEPETRGTGPMRLPLVMGGLPGWWVGRDDGRPYAPTISLNQWNSLLKKTGFSGIDAFTPLLDPLPIPASAFAAQAVDERINLLRRPLRSRAGQIQIQSLFLLGGKTLETSQLIEHLEDILTPYCEQVIRADSLEDIQGGDLPPLATVLSLTDLDSPTLKNITEERWESLKKLLTTSKNVLWITRGYRCEEPYAAMTVGLFRSIIYELTELRLQMLDIDELRKANLTVVAEILLRLQLTAQWEESQSQRNILWSMEPEMVIENETLYILRVMPQNARNDRYNSARRLITKDIDVASSVVNIEWRDAAYVLREGKSWQSTIRVDCSLLHSFQTPAGRLFLSLGINKETGVKVLSVSEKNSSNISVPKAWSTPVDVGKLSDAQYLSLIAGYLSSQQILTMMPIGGTLLVYEPEPLLASLLSPQVSAQGSCVIYATSKLDADKSHWLYIRPRMPKRSIDKLLHNNISLFLDLSRDSSCNGSLGSRIVASLPELCERRDISALITKESLVLPVAYDENIAGMLRKGVSFAATASLGIVDDMPLHVMTLREVLSNEVSTGLFSMVNWHGESTVPIMIEPVDTRKDLFEKEKTYWLVGLTGDLGQSICDWMIDHGARYIVLTSRSPKVPSEWIQAHAAAGATIACLLGYAKPSSLHTDALYH
jgi:SAM-dependent methyltransferase